MIGKTLTHYEIASPLGKGGMGEVYQAKDLKLGRDVAIKVLPEKFARDVDHIARFQRESKLLASLNHPNIAAIYGLEESGGTNFLVVELVEGETLGDQLKRGLLPVGEALKLALHHLKRTELKGRKYEEASCNCSNGSFCFDSSHCRYGCGPMERDMEVKSRQV
jgi:serine/threonine protein kinase